MNMRPVIQTLQLFFYTTRIARMLGAGRLAKQLRSHLARSRLVPFWAVAVAAFVIPWGAQHIPGTHAVASAGDECRVIRIVDGDTVRLDCGPGRDNLNVRLYCIDAPEMGQEPWGHRSRDHLRSITPDTVRIRVKDTDRYGRTVGEVLDGKRNLNLAMVRAGWAVEYERYCEVPGYGAAERRAQEAGLGVWREPGLQRRPWDWRAER